MKNLSRQQVKTKLHQRRMMIDPVQKIIFAIGFIFVTIAFTGCLSPKSEQKPKRLETSDATLQELEGMVNQQASISSLRSKVYLEIRDDTFAVNGVTKKYPTADATVVVQQPENILLNIEVPVLGSDIAQMTSNGTNFRIAVLKDRSDGKFISFLKGTNHRDYSSLQESAAQLAAKEGKQTEEDAKAFSNLRPQHLATALLMQPIDKTSFSYVMSSIIQEEFDVNAKKKSPTQWIFRGYYLMDELEKTDNGDMRIRRRFWFDRVGGINLTRQQLFTENGEIESDISYGKFGTFSGVPNIQLPLEVTLTRPEEKYQVRLIHKSPSNVTINHEYPNRAFLLENTKQLREIDLDKELESRKNRNQVTTN